MRRFLIIAFSFLIIAFQLFPCFIVSSSAAESESTYEWVNVLDYSTMNDSGENYTVWYFHEQQNLTFTYELPFTMVSSYFDLVFYFQQPITGVSINGHALSFEKIAQYTYRVYGSPTRFVTNSPLTITVSQSSSTGGGWFGVLKFNIGANTFISKNVNASFSLDAYDDTSLNLSYTGTSVSQILYFSQDIYSSQFVAYLDLTDWHGYDYIDFNLFFEVDQISSITGVFNDQNILEDVSWVNNATLGGSYFIQGRVNLKNIDRSLNDTPFICISGTLRNAVSSTNTGVNSFMIMSVTGLLETNLTNPYLYWLQQVYAAVKSGLAGNGQGAAIKDQTSQQADTINDAVADYGSYDKPSSSDVNSNLQFGDIVPASQISGSTSFLTAVFNVPSIFQVVTLALMLGLIATVIYGKR